MFPLVVKVSQNVETFCLASWEKWSYEVVWQKPTAMFLFDLFKRVWSSEHPTFGHTRALQCLNHINHRASWLFSWNGMKGPGWKESNYTPGRGLVMAHRRPTLHTFIWLTSRHGKHAAPLIQIRPPTTLFTAVSLAWYGAERTVWPLRPKSLETVGWIWVIFGPDYKCCETLRRFWLNLSKLSHIWPGLIYNLGLGTNETNKMWWCVGESACVDFFLRSYWFLNGAQRDLLNRFF